jgi:hypothetical protein
VVEPPAMASSVQVLNFPQRKGSVTRRSPMMGGFPPFYPTRLRPPMPMNFQSILSAHRLCSNGRYQPRSRLSQSDKMTGALVADTELDPAASAATHALNARWRRRCPVREAVLDQVIEIFRK